MPNVADIEIIHRIAVRESGGSEQWAGMDQHNDQTGEGAIDMLVGMLHNNEIGLPQFPRATLISGSWVGGGTVRGAAEAAEAARSTAAR